MSQYQYCEFAAVDGPISDEGMKYAEGCSSRADVSRFRLRNVYNYGDFHGNVTTLLKYYDAFFYISNWGTVQFALALPEGCLNQEAIQTYLTGYDREETILSFQNIEGRPIIWWERNEEDRFEWTEGEGIIDRLIPIREELISGDYRSLFLEWLAEFWPEEWQDIDDGEVLVPPIPPGLGDLSYSLQALIEQFPVDPDVLAAAAVLSHDAKSERIPITTVLDNLSAPEIKVLLQRVSEGQGSRVMSELNHLTYAKVEIHRQPLTCADLANNTIKIRETRLKEQARDEKAQIERAALARKHHLESVMTRADAIWNELDPLMVRKTASVYDDVAARLTELRDAYKQAGRDAEFAGRLASFRNRYQSRPTMMRRIEEL